VIQINGKVRSRINLPADEEGENIKTLALAEERIASLTAGKTIVKVVYVPKKLVNIVISG
jgi:leucyl-tRNA synthetase